MQSAEAIVLNTLTRVQRFMDTNASALGTINGSGYRRVLDDVVNTLNGHAVNQAASKRIGSGETIRQRVLRNSLRVKFMRPIANIAAAELRQVPEFTALKMPPVGTTSRRLIAAAGAMISAATPYKEVFVDGGLPDDFLAQLQAAADALSASMTNRGTSATTQAGATAGLKAEAARGRDALKVLDSLIEPQLANNQPLLVQWKSAKRYGGRTTQITVPVVDSGASAPLTQSTATQTTSTPAPDSPAPPTDSSSTTPDATPSPGA